MPAQREPRRNWLYRIFAFLLALFMHIARYILRLFSSNSRMKRRRIKKAKTERRFLVKEEILALNRQTDMIQDFRLGMTNYNHDCRGMNKMLYKLLLSEKIDPQVIVELEYEVKRPSEQELDKRLYEINEFISRDIDYSLNVSNRQLADRIKATKEDSAILELAFTQYLKDVHAESHEVRRGPKR